MKKALLAAGLAASTLMLSGAANAVPVFDITVWSGSPAGEVLSSTIADEADKPTGLSSAHFTFTGPINWFVGGPQNTDPSQNLFGDFITGGTISGFSSDRGLSQADFLASSMSIAGDSYSAYFHIVGSYSGTGVTGSISHDDGATVYDYLGGAVYSSPSETVDIVGAFSLPNGSHPFVVDYVEGNGSPSVLSLTVAGVPEPASWALLIVGFGGAGAALRCRRQTVTAAA